MELYLIEDYRESFPGIRGKELTEALILQILTENGYLPEAAKVSVRRLEGGKPVLEGAEGIRFSVSHTDDIFACVVCTAEDATEGGLPGEIGLDIQCTRKTDTQRLARRFFTEDETAYIEEKGSEAFYRLWTRKEAYAKYTGEGLAAILEKEPVLKRSDVDFTDLLLGDGLYGCICTGK